MSNFHLQIQKEITFNKYLCKSDYSLLKNWKYIPKTNHTPCDITKPQATKLISNVPKKDYLKQKKNNTKSGI